MSTTPSQPAAVTSVLPAMRHLANVPVKAGRVVSVTLFQGRLILACEWAVYELVGDDLVERVAVPRG